jgi:uncharacterized protein (DUF2235 family)
MPKHLICLIDGTWLSAHSDSAIDRYSNVFQLNIYLEPQDREGNPQIALYNRGLGATRGLSRLTAGAFAEGIDEMIAEVYINISANYQPGDRVYLIGFSRGAVIARAVAGLIGTYGLLPASRMNLFRDALDYFMGCDHSTRTKERLENACFESVEIEFMGAFDTAFGGNDKRSGMLRYLRFADHDLPSMVKHAVHLLSLDERRYYFQCLPWDRRKNQRQTLEQIWIPGTRSDVGGVYRDTILGEITLLTMVDRIGRRLVLTWTHCCPVKSGW